MSSLWSDLRGTPRRLLRAPAVTLSAVLCLGLGLGVTAATFSAIDRALLQRLPFREPDRLVTVYRTTPQFNTGPFSAPNYEDLARASHQLEAMAAVTPTTMLLSRPDDAAELRALRVTGNLFPMLGGRALAGRLIAPADDTPDASRVVVASEELWRTRFGADPGLVGSTIQLDGEAYTVVGILPEEFRVPHGARVLRAPLWVPMRFSENERSARRSNYLWVLGRLAPGASSASAQGELRGLFNGIVEAFPQLRGESLRLLSLPAEGARAVRAPLLLLGSAVAFVLLIAATDVASLLLARGVRRRREVAIRAALGASRWAVMRPVLLESLVLAGAGVLLGLGLAWIGVRTIGTFAAARLPQLAGLGINTHVIAFAIGIALVVAVLCGGLPAWRSAGVEPQDALRGGRGGGAGREQHRVLGGLVVTEVALSLVLLIGAALVLKGFATLVRNDPGFDPRSMLTLDVTISPQRYPDGNTASRFLEPALDAVRQVPGVRQAGAISQLPYVDWGWNFNMRYEGQPGDNPTQLPLVERRVVTPEFFAVTGQRLLAGRLLRQSDDERDESPAVVVVNDALVRRDFPDGDAVGKRFHLSDTTFATIVGVVSDIRNFGPMRDPRPEVYWTFRQGSNGRTTFPIVVRTTGTDPEAVTRPVLAAIRSVDPGAAISRAMPMTSVMAESVGQPRFYLTLLGVFAVVALVLAMAGLYGVMAYTVARRTREIGIRSALGSSTARTLWLVTGQGMRFVGLGVAIGLAGGFAVTRLLQSLLYGVSPMDAPMWLLATVALGGAGFLATVVPARRAANVDPVVAIRVE